jgi:hypothetical protein
MPEIHGSARGGELLGGSRGYLFLKAFLALNMDLSLCEFGQGVEKGRISWPLPSGFIISVSDLK